MWERRGESLIRSATATLRVGGLRASYGVISVEALRHTPLTEHLSYVFAWVYHARIYIFDTRCVDWNRGIDARRDKAVYKKSHQQQTVPLSTGHGDHGHSGSSERRSCMKERPSRGAPCQQQSSRSVHRHRLDASASVDGLPSLHCLLFQGSSSVRTPGPHLRQMIRGNPPCPSLILYSYEVP